MSEPKVNVAVTSDETKAQLDRINALEAKVKSLEMEKRITLIHSKWATFDGKDKSADFLDGVAYAVENYKPKSTEKVHAFAEVSPKSPAVNEPHLGVLMENEEEPIKGDL